MLRKLQSAYQKISLNEKRILQMLSIAYEPVTQTKVLQLLSRWNLTNKQEKKITQKEARAALQKLEHEKLLNDNNGYKCCWQLVEEITLDAYEEGVFESMLQIIRELLRLEMAYYDSRSSVDRSIREIRAAVYNKDYESFINSIKTAEKETPDIKYCNVYNLIFNSPFRKEWLRSLPQEFQKTALNNVTTEVIARLDSAKNVIEFMEESCNNTTQKHTESYKSLLATTYVLQGKFKEAQNMVQEEGKCSDFTSLTINAWIDFLKGKDDDAITKFSKAVTLLKKTNRKRKVYFDHISGIFFVLALIKTDNTDQHKTILQFINNVTKNNAYIIVYKCLEALVLASEGMMTESKEILYKIYTTNLDFMDLIIFCLVTLWFFPDERYVHNNLISTFKKAQKNKYEWVAMEIAGILSRLKPENKEYCKISATIQNNIGAESILSLIKEVKPWERSLKALKCLHAGTPENVKISANSRLAWFINPERSIIAPKEQTLNASGVWSKGRPVALKRIMQSELKCMTEQDHAIAKTIEKMEYSSYRYYHTEISYEFDYDKAMLALVGHPLVFLIDTPKVGIELIKAGPELIIKQNKDEFEMKFSIDFDETGVTVIKETPTRFQVIEITESHRKIFEILGGGSLRIPEKAKTQVLGAIENLSSIITIHSDIDGQAGNIPVVEANTKTCVHLMPVGDGLKLEMFVKPFTRGGPYCKPGSGGTNIFAEIDGEGLQTQRKLDEEKSNALDVILSCPSLAGMGQINETLHFEQPTDCLEVLLELKELGDKILLEWPEGEKIKISSTVSFDNLKLSINKETDWFGVSGELNVDESLTLDIQKVLELVEKTPGNFVPIGNGLFMSMTREFRKRMDELASLSDRSKNKIMFHPLASLSVQNIADNVNDLDVDKSWKSHVKRLKNAFNFKPELPSTLHAELRDYQIEGFSWLARLAKWGAGACLADDMGLGKTVQAIALILDRTTIGPTLVVAPASVCLNWLSETSRFAPTLKGELFGGRERKKTLKKLKSFDLLICSYGLLQTETEELSKIKWATIVLDEAQAIKNFATKRSKSAMALQGDFKMITTGTPIENHLGELWNLFRFINPGLLGSLERFNHKFANPIEKNKDVETKKHLKQLIQPFILRRLKSQVIEELPPKTEITLSVEMSMEEASFYEALRQQALKNLISADNSGGAKHIKILAEIMKLRRACCHSSLILPKSNIKSSKLALFTEVVKELIENKHKVLVFSQFVGHLSILSEQVEKIGVTYQYLDGSTPIKERQRRVDAFQAGVGDLFLISLKAGGLGLNLTAADYVIHMDPWWNPAVEDQASDRAHRIGQQRPVTIYRFVTKNTIEEKIVDLHGKKRGLADSLLEGTESAGKISAEELLQLIKVV